MIVFIHFQQHKWTIKSALMTVLVMKAAMIYTQIDTVFWFYYALLFPTGSSVGMLYLCCFRCALMHINWRVKFFPCCGPVVGMLGVVFLLQTSYVRSLFAVSHLYSICFSKVGSLFHCGEWGQGGGGQFI